MNISDVNLRNTNQSPMLRSSEEKGGVGHDTAFSRIEELINGNTFSREEISHLMEILDSRVDNEREKEKSSIDAGVDTQLVPRTHKIRRTPSHEKQLDIDRTTNGTSREKLHLPVGVGASPIDIARAYMAGRTSEGSHDPYNITSTGERAQPSNEFARKPLLPSSSPKPSICWPGAMVHDRYGYATPQSQRGRHRLYDYPRTPYSRTAILSKSTAKLQAESGYASTSTPFHQSQTSIYGQVKPKDDTANGYGSVGPIRRMRNKFSSEVRPRGSIFSPLKDSPSRMVKPVLGGFLPSTEKTLELGETSGSSKYWSGDDRPGSSDRAIANPNLSSGLAIRKILEQLDSKKPTPKEKEAELKLVTAWRSSPDATGTTQYENISSLQVEELASRKNGDVACANFPVEFDKTSSKSNIFLSFQDKGIDEAKGTVNGNTKASSSNTMSFFGLKGTPGPIDKSLNENALDASYHGRTETSSLFSRSHLSNGQDVRMELPKNNVKKPSLPSISINKPAENGPFGFTFPVSASSGVLSEPPTPSITPLSLASVVSIPNYTFGTNKSTPSPVFSFPPSSSSKPTQDDSDLKFSFGSDKKARLSFASFGTDGVCY